MTADPISYAGDGWTLDVGDSLAMMTAMHPASVDAIVTSPPYADQRAYEPGELGGRRGNNPANARIRARSRAQRSRAPDLWVDWIRPYTEQMLRVLTDQGTVMLNLGVVLRDGVEHDCVDRILDDCRAHGFRLLHRLIWHKPNGQVPSAPGYLTVSHEYVLWLAKTDRPWRAHEQPKGSQASREVRTPHSRASVARMAGLYTGAGAHRKQGRKHELHPDGARPTTVLVEPVGGEPNPNGHPARMPVRLARQLVAMTTPPDGMVLDPFAGDGTTLVAARRLGRRAAGCEINPEYARDAADRIRADAGMLDPDPVDWEQEALL